MMKHVAVVCVGLCFLLPTTAFGLMMPIGSLNRFPVSWTDYPRPAREQIEAALKADHCKYLRGNWTNGHIKLQFAGDTEALNEMLKRLVKCPAVSLTVAFENSDQPLDWRVDFAARDPQIRVIVNLKSQNIAVDRLAIPAANGPALKPSSEPPAAGK
jgi:hypothetical protein